MDISTTKMSSKGQIVIPVEMREGIKEGEKLVIIRNNNQIIIEKVEQISKSIEQDLIFAKKTEEALKRYEKGEFREVDLDEFIKK